MFGLPISTERKKQLPKKAIYAKFDLKPSQRESFDADIARIDIVAVVSSATVPALSEGAEIKEFYVLTVQMKRKEYDSKNITLLTKLIPQKMVLALQYEELTQFAIYHTKLISSTWLSARQVYCLPPHQSARYDSQCFPKRCQDSISIMGVLHLP